jgi:hypothetical protein
MVSVTPQPLNTLASAGYAPTTPRSSSCRQNDVSERAVLFKIYCQKISENTHWYKKLQNCSRNQFAGLVPRGASVKVSTSVGFYG